MPGRKEGDGVKTSGLQTQEDVAGVFGVSQGLVSKLVKVWDRLYQKSKDEILPSNSGSCVTNKELCVPNNLGLEHALLLTKLHDLSVGIEDQVHQELPDNQDLTLEVESVKLSSA